MNNEDKEQCTHCRKWFPSHKITFAPDDYAQELYADNTKVWMCDRCRSETSEDI